MQQPNRASRTDPTVPRDEAADIARGIGIILVVFGHVQRGCLDRGLTHHAELLRASDFVLYTTHMPLFFLLAGRNAQAALRKYGRRRYLAMRPAAIGWPYLLWSVLFVLTQQAASTTVAVRHAVPFTALLELPLVPIGIFWFLQALILAQGAAAMTMARPALLLAAALAGDLAITAAGPAAAVPGLAPTLLHLPFFAFGFLAAARGMAGPPWLSDPLVALPTAFGAAGLGLIAFASGAARPVDLWMLPVSALGITAILATSRALADRAAGTLLGRVGRMSMPIYLLHIFVLPAFIRVVGRLPPEPVGIMLLAGTACGVATPMALARLLAWARLDALLGLPAPRAATRAARASSGALDRHGPVRDPASAHAR